MDWARWYLAQMPTLPPDLQGYGLFAVAMGLVVLAILRWRDNDVKALTKELELKNAAREAKLQLEWQLKFDGQEARLQSLEEKIQHLENGCIAATMAAVEIKATSGEERTRILAQAIIDALSLTPQISAQVA